MRAKKYKILIIFYLIVVFFLIILTVKDHKEQDSIEHFAESMMLRSRKRKLNSECKSKCEAKYSNDPEKIKACKEYCKCKKRCNNDKKCIKKKCGEIKMNIYRDDKNKLKKMEIKEKLKSFIKNEKREKKKEKKKKEVLEKQKPKEKTEIKLSYVDEIIDKYFSDQEKDNLIKTHNDVRGFYKDVRKVLRIN